MAIFGRQKIIPVIPVNNVYFPIFAPETKYLSKHLFPHSVKYKSHLLLLGDVNFLSRVPIAIILPFAVGVVVLEMLFTPIPDNPGIPRQLDSVNMIFISISLLDSRCH